MAEEINNLVDQIRVKSQTRTTVKQESKDVFNNLKEIARNLVKEIKDILGDDAKDAKLEFENINDYEFHLIFAGELLVFNLHSTILNFPPEHVLNKSPWIQEDETRGYFGVILAYNFLSDSIKYKRVHDQGYLISRLFLNKDKHFYIEGLTQMSFLYPDVKNNLINEKVLSDFIRLALEAALETTPIMTSFDQDKQISVGEKLSRFMLGNVKKVGFQMLNQQKE